jgi:hypothetical protein
MIEFIESKDMWGRLRETSQARTQTMSRIPSSAKMPAQKDRWTEAVKEQQVIIGDAIFGERGDNLMPVRAT